MRTTATVVYTAFPLSPSSQIPTGRETVHGCALDSRLRASLPAAAPPPFPLSGRSSPSISQKSQIPVLSITKASIGSITPTPRPASTKRPLPVRRSVAANYNSAMWIGMPLTLPLCIRHLLPPLARSQHRPLPGLHVVRRLFLPLSTANGLAQKAVALTQSLLATVQKGKRCHDGRSGRRTSMGVNSQREGTLQNNNQD